jgi:hypothetical protein
MDDGLVKSLKRRFSVTPVKMGIQFFQIVVCSLDFCIRRNDDFLRRRHGYFPENLEPNGHSMEIT